VAQNPYDAARPEVAYQSVGSRSVISELVSGGRLGGLLEARQGLVDEARNVLGRVGITLTSTVNAQHQRGVDLDGNPGERIFSDLAGHAPRVAAHVDNGSVPPPTVEARVTDVAELTTSDYRLEAQGARISVVRLADGAVTVITDPLVNRGYPGSTAHAEVDGLTLEVSGALASGDSFLVQPTRLASREMAVELTDPRQLAAASPVASNASLANAGGGSVSPAEVVDPVAYVPGDYEVLMTAATGAAVGAGAGAPVDDLTTPDTLGYQLEINGQVIYDTGATPPPTPPADLNALAGLINGAGAGVRAEVHDNGSGPVLHLARDPARQTPITVTERLTGASDPGDQVSGFFGSALDGAAPTGTVTLDAAADSYVVVDGGGNAVASGSYMPGTAIGFNGIEVSVDGAPALGDAFTVGPNTNGVGDNRNALDIADLQLTGFINSGTATYQDAYGELVVHIGGITRESGISRDAQETLLQNAVSARDAVSGVNLDEEAADLMRFQQAYQASAQVITAAQTMFDALLGAVRG
jgi:flagellar hook-associated protein 1 FlgK